MLLIKDKIKHSNIRKINIEGHEILQCKIFPNYNNKYINLNAIYVPPNRKINLDILELINTENTIIVGDLNCKHTKWGCNSTNNNGKTLNKNLYDINLENIDVPLNYVHYRNNITRLDHIQQIMTNIIRNFSISSVTALENLGSDHLPILFEINFYEKTIANKCIKLYHKLNTSLAESILSKINPSPCSFRKEIEKRTQDIQAALTEIESSIPTKIINNNLGLNVKTRNLINKRRKLKTLLNRNKSSHIIKNSLKEINKTIKKEIEKERNLKRDKIMREINSDHDSRKSWRHIKKLQGKKNKFPTKIIDDKNIIYKTKEEIQKLLNKGRKTFFKPNKSNNIILEELSNIWSNNTKFNSKEYTEIKEEEVYKTIDKLKLGKAPGVFRTAIN